MVLCHFKYLVEDKTYSTFLNILQVYLQWLLVTYQQLFQNFPFFLFGWVFPP